ncbi:Protein CBG08481 [Caenorhabditis briggsae]|uniref:Uncharacterized protein n=3 Tax=Caenorhabditis briggsae TaxID=6238 RepID=A0AAE9J082_CAEBR|nr:Protein CBG08481 [Caenorhabditis briggsae]ULU13343.1 hypothetical protein L3Y34_016085 [Caenorhabditis briggsae]CAP28297.2 Protein CBG08481 [Caenorhabditis briggsae]
MEDTLVTEQFFSIAPPTPTKLANSSFQMLVEESQNSWKTQSEGDIFDKIVFRDDELYDSTQDSFRYGRVTTGPSYNLVTGKMPEKIFEEVKTKDEENDEVEDAGELEEVSTITETFLEMYHGQMPKYFDYRSNFPEIRGIWTLLFDQEHYEMMSTFELQAAICAALNSKHYLMICIGVDAYNTVTGVEMSAVDRVTFRMALTRAVAGEFQPPLVKIAPKLLTGVSPMKRDVSELTTSIDVLFVPVIGEKEENRFLIVVRVKELSERFYQLSSGRIYKEQEGRVVEMASLNDAFHLMLNEQSMSDMQERRGSMFMREPEPFVTEGTSIVMDELKRVVQKEEKVQNINKKSLLQSLLYSVDLEHIGWILFGSALSICFYKNAIKPLVK